MVGGEVYIGVGNDKKQAKQTAAKRALRSLNEKENPGPVVRFFMIMCSNLKDFKQTEHVSFIGLFILMDGST